MNNMQVNKIIRMCSMHKYILTKIVVSILIIIMSACSGDISDEQEYKAWFRDMDNGYIKKKDVSGLSFTVRRLPDDTMRKADNDNEFIRFVLEVASGEKGNRPHNTTTYTNYIQYTKELAFHIGSRVWLEDERGKTYYSLMHHYQSGYELTDREQIIFVFEKPRRTEEVTFVYDDNLYLASRLKFLFDFSLVAPTFPKE